MQSVCLPIVSRSSTLFRPFISTPVIPRVCTSCKTLSSLLFSRTAHRISSITYAAASTGNSTRNTSNQSASSVPAKKPAQNKPRKPRQPRPAPPVSQPPPANKAKYTPDIQYLQIDLPQGDFSRIKKAEFVKSSVSVNDCPKHKLPEFAVIGRSNVGKSSLINCLTSQSKLARVSKDPGQTKCINHYIINDSWYLVDLPGYGYAKQSRDARKEWLEFTKDFFINRDTLCHVLLLVDGSVPVQLTDVDCANWLGECQIPFSIVFTKVDKTGKDGNKYVNDFKLEMMKDWEAIPLCFETSSKTGAGRSELQRYIAGLRKLWQASQI